MKYRIARSLDPDLSPARDNLGILLAIRGDFPGAVAGDLRAVELEPRNAAVRRNLASTDYASGNIEGAIREFRKTVELAPGNLRARAELAMSYIAPGRHGEAVGELENAKAHGVRIETRLLEALDRSTLPAHPKADPVFHPAGRGLIWYGRMCGQGMPVGTRSGRENGVNVSLK